IASGTYRLNDGKQIPHARASGVLSLSTPTATCNMRRILSAKRIASGTYRLNDGKQIPHARASGVLSLSTPTATC
ncbi:hypothetical protein, partial [Escherichia coli]|uniref:hypothetical protein n=1 Tax=Escherichia coli TaxID=562 RepID=UPI001BC8C044